MPHTLPPCAHAHARYQSHDGPTPLGDGRLWVQHSWPCPSCHATLRRAVYDTGSTDDGDWTATAVRGPWAADTAGLIVGADDALSAAGTNLPVIDVVRAVARLAPAG